MRRYKEGDKLWALIPPPIDSKTAKTSKLYKVIITEISTTDVSEDPCYNAKFVDRTDGKLYFDKFGTYGFPFDTVLIVRESNIGITKLGVISRTYKKLANIAHQYHDAANYISSLVGSDLAEEKANSTGKVVITKT